MVERDAFCWNLNSQWTMGSDPLGGYDPALQECAQELLKGMGQKGCTSDTASELQSHVLGALVDFVAFYPKLTSGPSPFLKFFRFWRYKMEESEPEV